MGQDSGSCKGQKWGFWDKAGEGAVVESHRASRAGSQGCFYRGKLGVPGKEPESEIPINESS